MLRPYLGILFSRCSFACRDTARRVRPNTHRLVGTHRNASAKTKTKKQFYFTKRHNAKNGPIEFSLLGRYIAPTEKKFFSNWENKSPQLDSYIEKKKKYYIIIYDL